MFLNADKPPPLLILLRNVPKGPAYQKIPWYILLAQEILLHPILTCLTVNPKTSAHPASRHPAAWFTEIELGGAGWYSGPKEWDARGGVGRMRTGAKCVGRHSGADHGGFWRRGWGGKVCNGEVLEQETWYVDVG